MTCTIPIINFSISLIDEINEHLNEPILFRTTLFI